VNVSSKMQVNVTILLNNLIIAHFLGTN
jgi:hypothetical protein